VFIVGLGYFVYALCHGAAAFPLATGAWSIGEIVFMPVASATVAALAPAGLQGRYQGAWSFAPGVGMTTSPVLGAAIMSRFGAVALWTSCLVVGAAASAAFLSLAKRIRERMATAA